MLYCIFSLKAFGNTSSKYLNEWHVSLARGLLSLQPSHDIKALFSAVNITRAHSMYSMYDCCYFLVNVGLLQTLELCFVSLCKQYPISESFYVEPALISLCLWSETTSAETRAVVQRQSFCSVFSKRAVSSKDFSLFFFVHKWLIHFVF